MHGMSSVGFTDAQQTKLLTTLNLCHCTFISSSFSLKYKMKENTQ